MPILCTYYFARPPGEERLQEQKNQEVMCKEEELAIAQGEEGCWGFVRATLNCESLVVHIDTN